jgi:hypothetical protein
MPRVSPVLALLIAASSVPGAAGELHAQQSHAMRAHCQTIPYGAPSDAHASGPFAERWVRERLAAFVPTPEQALRMRSLELQSMQVQLAFYSISRTCQEYRAGAIAAETADLSLAGYEQAVANFLHDVGNEARVLAARGQVADMDAIRQSLTDLGAAGRQAALMGEDSLAERAREEMVNALVSFSGSFVNETCWEQTFDDDLPYSLERQNQLLGTGIDVLPCARRRFTALAGSLVFESCSVRGVGEWRVRSSLAALPMFQGGVGTGEMSVDGGRAKGTYAVDWGANGVEYRTSGDMSLDRTENGPGVAATYTFSANADVRVTRGREMVAQLERLMGVRAGGGTGTFTLQPRVSERPCRSLDG